MSDPTQQPPSDPYRPQDPYQPQAPYQGPSGPAGPPPGPQGPLPPYGRPQPMFDQAPKPNHPQATTAMVLGIVALVGGFMCLLPLFAAPAAWIMGSKAVKEIDASNGRLGGRGEAQAGFITGIVGTVLLVLGLLAVIAFVVIVVVAANGSDSEYSYNAIALLLGRQP